MGRDTPNGGLERAAHVVVSSHLQKLLHK